MNDLAVLMLFLSVLYVQFMFWRALLKVNDELRREIHDLRCESWRYFQPRGMILPRDPVRDAELESALGEMIQQELAKDEQESDIA